MHKECAEKLFFGVLNAMVIVLLFFVLLTLLNVSDIRQGFPVFPWQCMEGIAPCTSFIIPYRFFMSAFVVVFLLQESIRFVCRFYTKKPPSPREQLPEESSTLY